MSPQKIVALFAGALVVILIAWKLLDRGDESPEAQIRAALDRAVEAAEKKDLGGMLEIVSDNFHTGEMTVEDVKKILFVQLNQNSSRRIVLTGTSVEIADDSNAKVFTDAVLAGANVQEGIELSGSMYHFELSFKREDDEWKIVSALWQRK